jgi:hypothetical protein
LINVMVCPSACPDFYFWPGHTRAERNAHGRTANDFVRMTIGATVLCSRNAVRILLPSLAGRPHFAVFFPGGGRRHA